MKININIFGFFILISAPSFLFCMEAEKKLGKRIRETELASQEAIYQNKKARLDIHIPDTVLMQIEDFPENLRIINGLKDLPEEIKPLIFSKVIHNSLSVELAYKILECAFNFFEKQSVGYFQYKSNINQILNFLIAKWGLYKLFTVELPNFLYSNSILNDSDKLDSILEKMSKVQFTYVEVVAVYKTLILMGLNKKADLENIGKLIVEFGYYLNWQEFKNESEIQTMTTLKRFAEYLIVYGWNKDSVYNSFTEFAELKSYF